MTTLWAAKQRCVTAITNRPSAITAAFYVSIVLGVFNHVLRPDPSRRWFGWDCLNDHWQDLIFPLRAFANGEWPGWNPFALMGEVFDGDPQTGLFSPINWLLWLIAAVAGDTGPWLIQIKVLLWMWIGLLGMHWFVHRQTHSHIAAALASVAYLLGSPNLTVKDSSGLWPLMALPWAALAMRDFVTKPSRHTAMWLGLGIWFCGSAGNPPTFFYALLVLTGVWLSFTLVPFSAVRESLLSQLRAAPLAMAIASLLLLPIFLPTWILTGQSVRAERGLAYALDWPMPVNRLVDIIWPTLDDSWFTDVYMGVMPLVCALAGVLTAPNLLQRQRRLLYIAFIAFGFCLAFGAATPILPFAARHIPGFDLFRFAFRYKLVIPFFVSLLAAECVADILRSPKRIGRHWAIPAFGVAWIVATLLLLFTSNAPVQLKGVKTSLVLGSFMLCLVTGAFLKWNWRLRFIAIAVLVTLIELTWVGQPVIDITVPLPDHDAYRAKLFSLSGIRNRHSRYIDPTVRNLGMAFGAREFGGYVVSPLRLANVDAIHQLTANNPQALAHFNVRWQVAENSTHSIRAKELTHPSPLAQVYYAASVLSPSAMLDRFRDPTPLTSAMVEELPGDFRMISTQHPPPSHATVEEFTTNRLQLHVRAQADGILVLNEAYYPGWTATVDGQSVPVFKANYVMRAITVPSGNHQVVFAYQPSHRFWLLACWLAGWGLVAWARYCKVGLYPVKRTAFSS